MSKIWRWKSTNTHFFHIPKPTGLSTVMFEITKEYIEKHPKTHKKRHNFAKKQNFKNLREALLDIH